jgi:DNA-binding MarR family transcriptional regulator
MNAISPKTSAPRPSPRLPDELVASPTFLIKRLGFAAKERAMAAYEETGLHPYHHAILIVLDEGSHANQGSIADALGYDHGAARQSARRARRRGSWNVALDPDDRRRHLVPPRRKQALRRFRALARQLEDEFLVPLDGRGGACLFAPPWPSAAARAVLRPDIEPLDA